MACSPKLGLPTLGCCARVPVGAFCIQEYKTDLWGYKGVSLPGTALVFYNTCAQSFRWTLGPSSSKTTSASIDLLTGAQTISQSAIGSFDSDFAAWFARTVAGEHRSLFTRLSDTSFKIECKKPFTLNWTDPATEAFEYISTMGGALDLESYVVGADRTPLSLFDALDKSSFPALSDAQTRIDYYAYSPLTGAATPTGEDFFLPEFWAGHLQGGYVLHYGFFPDVNGYAGDRISTDDGWIVQQNGIFGVPITDGTGPRVTALQARAYKSIGFFESLACHERARDFNPYTDPWSGTVELCAAFGGSAAANKGGLIIPRPGYAPGSIIPTQSALYWVSDLLFFKASNFGGYTDGNPACCTFPNPAP